MPNKHHFLHVSMNFEADLGPNMKGIRPAGYYLRTTGQKSFSLLCHLTWGHGSHYAYEGNGQKPAAIAKGG